MSGAARQTRPRAMGIEEFRVVLQDHLLWLQSEGREGRRANLSAHDLSGLKLEGIFLPDANLRGADLTGANLSDANLQGADFSEAIVESANFRNAQLEGANFARCLAKGAYFDNALLINSNFTAANLEDASCIGVNFGGAKFRDAVLNGADFTRANLQHATLRHVTALETVFDGADFTQADCRDGLFNYARFKDSVMLETQLRNAQFDHVVFTESDFTRAYDLAAHYQTQSIESEKRGIFQEMQNLREFREEVEQYEKHITEQKKELLVRRKLLDSLNESEEQITSSLFATMRQFRNIAIFWFVVVALFATILFGRIAEIGADNLNYLEIGVVLAVLVGVLGAHILSAVLSYRVAKRFARHVRVRRERLGSGPLLRLHQETLSLADEHPAREAPQEPHAVTYL